MAGNTPQTTQNNAVIKQEEKRLAILSIVIPLVVSIGFMFFDMKANCTWYNQSKFVIPWNDIISLANNYINLTVLSTGIFLLLEQFFLFIPSGVEKSRGIVLCVATLVYMGFYFDYMNNQTLGNKKLMLVMDLLYLLAAIYSINVKKAEKDVRSFVAPDHDEQGGN